MQLTQPIFTAGRFRSNVKLAEGELQRSEARAKQAELAYRRGKTLIDTNSVADFENVEAMYYITKAESVTAAVIPP